MKDLVTDGATWKLAIEIIAATKAHLVLMVIVSPATRTYGVLEIL